MINSILLGMFGLGGPEITLVVIALVLLFGGKKIPELMKGLGKGIKEFKDASKGVDSDVDSKTPEEEELIDIGSKFSLE